MKLLTAALLAALSATPAPARDASAGALLWSGAAASAGPLRYASTFKSSSWRREVGGGDPCAEAVALVESSVGRSSGFLVGGLNRVLISTAHGLVDKEAGRPLRRATVRFDQSGDGPVSLGATVIRVGATSEFATGNAARDWAILLLDRPAPRVESLTVRYAERPMMLQLYGSSLALVAYHYDFMSGDRAAISEGCSISNAAHGLVLHDCDAMVGSSGGPIVHREGNRCDALAINQGSLGRHRRNLDYTALGADANANRAVPLGNLRGVLEPLLRRVEAGAGARQLLGAAIPGEAGAAR
jgi:hypothetical protein